MSGRSLTAVGRLSFYFPFCNENSAPNDFQGAITVTLRSQTKVIRLSEQEGRVSNTQLFTGLSNTVKYAHTINNHWLYFASGATQMKYDESSLSESVCYDTPLDDTPGASKLNSPN